MKIHTEKIILTAIVLLVSFYSVKSQQVKRIPLPSVKGDFIMVPELSDEFEDSFFDTTKWFRRNPTWLGRQPAFFSENNVFVKGGSLNLVMKKEEPNDALRQRGYNTYSSAAVKSRNTILYGYFEIRARAMNSHGSSAFWFYDQAPGLWTEIDVFEICGKGERENQYNMNIHVFRTPLKNEHWSINSEWRAPYRFADDFHVFGLEWTPYVIRWYVDADTVRTSENTHWHQPLTMNFDSETMPDWFGLPSDDDLPSTFSIDYVRTWKYTSGEWLGEGPWQNRMRRNR